MGGVVGNVVGGDWVPFAADAKYMQIVEDTCAMKLFYRDSVFFNIICRDLQNECEIVYK